MPWTGASSLSSWIFRTCDVSLFLHVVWPASPAAAHRFRRPSVHVQLTSGTVRMKSVIELANSHMTQSTWVFVMDCARAIMALTWGSWGYGPAERWHLLPRPNYLIWVMSITHNSKRAAGRAAFFMPSPDDSQDGVQNSTDGFGGPDSRGSESANGRLDDRCWAP